MRQYFKCAAMAACATLIAHVGVANATATLYLPGTYIFTAPLAGIYDIDAQGGSGGSTIDGSGGFAANAFGSFTLSAGEQLGIRVGGQGGGGATTSDGGGGSFVYIIASNTLLLAGGGGGGSYVGADDYGWIFGGGAGNGGTSSSALTESGGSVAGVDGQGGSCCGGYSHGGSGGLSFLNLSTADGYYANGSISLAGARGDGSVVITPASLAAAVPEPASWAMMITGFGAVGSVMRRRAKAVTRLSHAH